GRLELMLDIEQPDTDGTRQQGEGEMYQQELFEANRDAHKGHEAGEPHIGPQNAPPLTGPRFRDDRGKAVPDVKMDHGADAKEDQRVPIYPIFELPSARELQVFGH